MEVFVSPIAMQIVVCGAVQSLHRSGALVVKEWSLAPVLIMAVVLHVDGRVGLQVIAAVARA